MRHLTAMPPTPIRILPLVYPSAIAQMVSYRRILQGNLSLPVLWSVRGDLRLAVEEPYGYCLINGLVRVVSVRAYSGEASRPFEWLPPFGGVGVLGRLMKRGQRLKKEGVTRNHGFPHRPGTRAVWVYAR